MKIEHIDDVLPAIAGRKEFVVFDKGDYKVIDYVYMDENTFDDPVQLECRGIKFNRDGYIIARPFKKFFNYGERGTDLPLHKPHTITKKLDGSMIHSAVIDGRVTLMTRKGETDIAAQAAEIFLEDEIYLNFIQKMHKLAATPIFEFTSPENRIVIGYEEPRLTLLGIRANQSGRLSRYQALTKVMVHHPGIPLVEVHKNTRGVDDFVQHTRDLEGEEGHVVQFDDGSMVKIKADAYVQKHRALDGLNTKRRVVELILDGNMDDVLPLLNGTDQKELRKFSNQLNFFIHHKAMVAEDIVSEFGHLDRKVFATTKVKGVDPTWLKSCIFQHLDGRDSYEAITKFLRQHPEAVPVKWRDK